MVCRNHYQKSDRKNIDEMLRKKYLRSKINRDGGITQDDYKYLSSKDKLDLGAVSIIDKKNKQQYIEPPVEKDDQKEINKLKGQVAKLKIMINNGTIKNENIGFYRCYNCGAVVNTGNYEGEYRCKYCNTQYKLISDNRILKEN